MRYFHAYEAHCQRREDAIALLIESRAADIEEPAFYLAAGSVAVEGGLWPSLSDGRGCIEIPQ